MCSTIIHYLSIILIVILLVSCQDEDNELQLSSVVPNNEIISNNGLVSTHEIQDSLGHTEPYEINTIDDLMMPMQKADSIFKKVLETGDFIYFPASWSIQSRVSSSKHIAYVHLPIIINDDAINQKMYFKTKFGASLVNKINAIYSEKNGYEFIYNILTL